MGALGRRLRALERRVGDNREFRAGAPPVDEDGLPDWTGDGLTFEGFERAMGLQTDEELTEFELACRDRLKPYAEVFKNLDKPSEGAP